MSIDPITLSVIQAGLQQVCDAVLKSAKQEGWVEL